MFTGLIRELGFVKSFSQNRLCMLAKYSPNIGDSIAVNGACLTVVEVFGGGFCVELSEESLNILAIENFANKVHIEPAMRLSDRLEGHILQGHIDSVGVLEKITKNKHGVDFFISLKKEFLKFCTPKGSVAIDGVSLTINDVFSDSFRLTIIPHSFKSTNFSDYKIGRRLNIETDFFARYLYFLFKEKPLNWSDIDKTMFLY